MIGDALVAGECALFGEARRAAGHVGLSLIVAEAREQSVLGGKVFVHAEIELAFVELPHRLAHVVITESGIVGIGQADTG